MPGSMLTSRRRGRFAAMLSMASLAAMVWAAPKTVAEVVPDPSNPEHLKRAAAYNARNGGISMLVMVEGRVIFEDYPNGGAPGLAMELASGTKSFSGVLAVAAEAEGLLRLDEPVSDTIHEWRGDPRKVKMTLRQLLSLTGGLDGGDQGRPPVYAEALMERLVDEPGRAFHYGPVPFQVFGEVMRRKLAARGQSPLDYLNERIFMPIGLKYARWRHGSDGNPHMPSGAALTAREWAKFGELIRLGGRWAGQRILPADGLAECFEGTSANPAYGLTWWLNRDVPPEIRKAIPQLTAGTDDISHVTGIPRDIVFAAGAGKQRLYVCPSLKLVAVRQARGIVASLAGRKRSGFSDKEFLSFLLTGQAAP